MKKILLLLVLCLSALLLTACGDNENNNPDDNNGDGLDTSEENTVHLVVMAGQSGARGKALVNDLNGDWKIEDVDIMADGCPMGDLDDIPTSPDEELIPDVLEPGYGDFPSEFGPELGIGQTLASRYQKGDLDYKSVIVKYTGSGSTFISDWYSKSAVNDQEVYDQLDDSQIRELEDGSFTGPLTHNLYQLIDNTKAYLEELGYNVVIDGATFIHGEQDAKYDENMAIYEKCLKYFIQDLREYVGDSDLPFVIPEALTNSAKYSNQLRDIQNRIANQLQNVSLIKTYDLYTNIFEPWHFGAESNNILGNRIAAEIVSYNDNRVITSVDQEVINVPKGVEVALPEYVKATFDNEYSGYVKVVNYTQKYNPNTLGEQTVKFNVKTVNGLEEKTFKVNVSDKVASIDGILNEYSNVKENVLPNNLGKVYVIKGETGLYIAAQINDSQVWTDGGDGEYWHKGDLHQREKNDDFRVYLTTSDAANRKAICVSSANLLRVYDKVSLTATDSELLKNNLVYNKKITQFKNHVTTSGLVNDSSATSSGLTFELYISYADLQVTNPDDIKLCFSYYDASEVSGNRTFTTSYFVKDEVEGYEENDSAYFMISELIS